VDFTRIYANLALGKETASSLQAFRKRHTDALRMRSQLASQPTTLDFEHYRSVLKNKDIVAEAEKILKDFKPITYDVSAQVKAIEAFEEKAVTKAQETAGKVDEELVNLQSTLANIEEARSFEELTVADVGKAHPHIFKTVETMMQKGKWTVPGYKEKFGDMSLM